VQDDRARIERAAVDQLQLETGQAGAEQPPAVAEQVGRDYQLVVVDEVQLDQALDDADWGNAVALFSGQYRPSENCLRRRTSQ
jgi:hypothetical protein